MDAAEAKVARIPAGSVRALNRERTRLEHELVKRREMMDMLFGDYHERRIITADQFAQKNREYLEIARGLEAQLYDVGVQLSNPHAKRDAIRAARASLAGLTEVWDDLPPEERADVLRHIGLRLTVQKDGVEMSLFGVTEKIAGYPSTSTLFFGDAVDGLHHKGRLWSKAQTDYLIKHWATQTTAQIAEAIGRRERGVRQKVTNLQRGGLLPYKRPDISGPRAVDE